MVIKGKHISFLNKPISYSLLLIAVCSVLLVTWLFWKTNTTGTYTYEIRSSMLEELKLLDVTLERDIEAIKSFRFQDTNQIQLNLSILADLVQQIENDHLPELSTNPQTHQLFKDLLGAYALKFGLIRRYITFRQLSKAEMDQLWSEINLGLLQAKRDIPVQARLKLHQVMDTLYILNSGFRVAEPQDFGRKWVSPVDLKLSGNDAELFARVEARFLNILRQLSEQESIYNKIRTSSGIPLLEELINQQKAEKLKALNQIQSYQSVFYILTLFILLVLTIFLARLRFFNNE
jgi:hypothetical protein